MPSKGLGDIQHRVGSALGVDPAQVSVDSCRSSQSGWILKCTGNVQGRRFFAKIYLVDQYPVYPRFAVAGDESASQGSLARAVDNQIETEWNMTHQMRALVGDSCIPAPLGKSIEKRIFVSVEVKGTRLDHLMKWSRWDESRAKSCEIAMFRAGALLRKAHERSFQRIETVDPLEVMQKIRNYLRVKGLESTKYATLALKPVEAARQQLRGRAKLNVPFALNHGDFSLPNLIWDSINRRIWLVDFELSGYKTILHDLGTIIFSLRANLMNPLASHTTLNFERAFWAGYGLISEDIIAFVNAVASSRIFYYLFPKLLTRRERRGWLAGVTASAYRALFERSVIERILTIPPLLVNFDRSKDMSLIAAIPPDIDMRTSGQ
jgi:hypothetical protein